METTLKGEKLKPRHADRRTGPHDRRLPNERDEAPDQEVQPRGVMRQAAEDLKQGLVDTDLHNTPGIDRGVRPRGPAKPLPDAGEGMRGQGTAPTGPRK